MLKIWNKTDSIIQPNGVSYTPEEIFADPNFGFSRHVETVLEMQGPITVAIDNIHILLQVYDLDENLTGQGALDAIKEARQKQRDEQKAQAEAQAEAMAANPFAAMGISALSSDPADLADPGGLTAADHYLIERIIKIIPAVVAAVEGYRQNGLDAEQ